MPRSTLLNDEHNTCAKHDHRNNTDDHQMEARVVQKYALSQEKDKYSPGPSEERMGLPEVPVTAIVLPACSQDADKCSTVFDCCQGYSSDFMFLLRLLWNKSGL
jgi:hypothetical protein